MCVRERERLKHQSCWVLIVVSIVPVHNKWKSNRRVHVRVHVSSISDQLYFNMGHHFLLVLC